MNPLTTPPDAVMEAAIDWMVLLRSGRVTEAERRRFERWCDSDARHAQAWQRLEDKLAQPVQAIARLDNDLPGGKARIRNMLVRPTRRSALGAVALLATGSGGLTLAVDRYAPVTHLMADLRTRTAERRTFSLPDNSRLDLNARSAADLAFGADVRRVELLTGEAVVQAAEGAAGSRLPLCLSTRHAAAYTRGQVYAQVQDGYTRLFALQAPMRVVTAAGEVRFLDALQGAELDAQGVRPAAPVVATEADWLRGYLTAAPLSLGDVIAALQRYTPRVMQVSADAARLAVQASLPLDDVDRSLRALEDVLPIRIRQWGGWWTRIDVR
ncbi:FecR family protein [Comamonas sp. BIGb0124]|uniref:DUF4880 domain-containing protein n=1 Tax=Comamonas sp. BIGb0124 TaxID=2485130 RepID=UPI000F45FF94|nr:DUF4880 domain-containing protein [Comamonas sp. BIGb0124]ROR21376.1 FecR family protein [Comamonas sp. BIGb0124]